MSKDLNTPDFVNLLESSDDIFNTEIILEVNSLDKCQFDLLKGKRVRIEHHQEKNSQSRKSKKRVREIEKNFKDDDIYQKDFQESKSKYNDNEILLNDSENQKPICEIIDLCFQEKNNNNNFDLSLKEVIIIQDEKQNDRLNTLKKQIINFGHNYIDLEKTITISSLSEDEKKVDKELINELNKFTITSFRNKINIVLDLDMTLIYAKLFNGKTSILENTDDYFYIKIEIQKIIYNFRLKIRNYTIELLKKLSQFCNIYVFTHGQTPYATEVIKILVDLSI